MKTTRKKTIRIGIFCGFLSLFLILTNGCSNSSGGGGGEETGFAHTLSLNNGAAKVDFPEKLEIESSSALVSSGRKNYNLTHGMGKIEYDGKTYAAGWDELFPEKGLDIIPTIYGQLRKDVGNTTLMETLSDGKEVYLFIGNDPENRPYSARVIFIPRKVIYQTIYTYEKPGTIVGEEEFKAEMAFHKSLRVKGKAVKDSIDTADLFAKRNADITENSAIKFQSEQPKM